MKRFAGFLMMGAIGLMALPDQADAAGRRGRQGGRNRPTATAQSSHGSGQVTVQWNTGRNRHGTYQPVQTTSRYRRYSQPVRSRRHYTPPVRVLPHYPQRPLAVRILSHLLHKPQPVVTYQVPHRANVIRHYPQRFRRHYVPTPTYSCRSNTAYGRPSRRH